MNLASFVHGRHGHHATHTPAPAATPAPIPAAVGSRTALLDRLGVTDPEASDEQILSALDALTAAKAAPIPASKAKRAQPSEADKLYALAWPDSKPKAASTRIVTAEDKLYELAWGNETKGA